VHGNPRSASEARSLQAPGKTPSGKNSSLKNPSPTHTGYPLKVIPLGGMREIGKNMFVYEYRDDIIIVDCGIGFPEEDMPGIDIVIPDMSYVFKNRSKIRGVFFTHGHEDHIGAVAWLTNEVKVPLYGSKLAIALIRSKLEDRGGSLRNVELHPVDDGAIVTAGAFSVEFIHSNHSIADANILAISTPVGLVIHTGDFKIDYTPINGDPMDLARLAVLGQQKPLLLMCESTNVEKSGFSMSESKVGESFAGIFEKATGRIIVATFSSNIYRMQQIFTAAERYNRKVCLIGRSVINVFTAANSLGYMKILPNTLIDINQIRNYPPEQVVIISTGSQGEPLAALTRMAFNEHQKIEISQGDTVILSSTPIPGNEKPIYRVINELYLRGANVIYASLAEVHASGHAYQEELKIIHQLVRSRFFVPMHGEYRMLFQHSALAQRMGARKEDIFLLCNGDILELTEDSARVTGYIPADGVLVDGSGYAESGNAVLKDRIALAEDGVITVAVAVDAETASIVGEPVINTRGFAYESESDEIVKECKAKVFAFVRKSESANKPLLQMLKSGALREQLRDYLFERTRRRPIIILSIIEL
jgi:ribonuclease J